MAERTTTAWKRSIRRATGIAFAMTLALVAVSPTPAHAAGTLDVTKIASPTSLPEPGGTFTFSVTITNNTSGPITLESLDDGFFGDVASQGSCTDLVGTVLAIASSYSCQFNGTFTGNAGDLVSSTITAAGVDEFQEPVSGSDETGVSITDAPPQVTVAKAVSPATLPAPGGTFTYTVTVTNPSVEPITILGLTDDIFGDLSTRGSCNTAIGTVVAPGGTYTCSFPGAFTAGAGTSLIDQVTVTVEDDELTQAKASDTATVTITPAVPGTTTTSTRPRVTTTTTSATSVTSTSSVPGVPPATTTTTIPDSLELLSGPSSEPGGELQVRGAGCTPNSRVDLLIGTSPVGAAQAGADGTFEATVTLPDLPPGRIELVAVCGLRLTAVVDIVVVSQVDALSSTLAVFIFFVLLALVLFRRRRVILPRSRPTPDDDDR